MSILSKLAAMPDMVIEITEGLLDRDLLPINQSRQEESCLNSCHASSVGEIC